VAVKSNGILALERRGSSLVTRHLFFMCLNYQIAGEMKGSFKERSMESSILILDNNFFGWQDSKIYLFSEELIFQHF
jgi:hypothetical protein